MESESLIFYQTSIVESAKSTILQSLSFEETIANRGQILRFHSSLPLESLHRLGNAGWLDGALAEPFMI